MTNINLFFYHSAGRHVYFQHPPSSVVPPGAAALKLLATSIERWQRLQDNTVFQIHIKLQFFSIGLAHFLKPR